MCVNCISTAEQVAAEAGLVFALLRDPAHRALAATGVLDPPDPVKRDVRTVGFLRALALDPAEILGPDVVDVADAWVPSGRQVGARRWRRPIASQSLLAAK